MENDGVPSEGKRLVIQGKRGSEVVYLDGPPSAWGSWRERPFGLSWELDQVESAENYLRQVRTQQGASLGASVTNIILRVYDFAACAPSPPPPGGGLSASAASALSPSPHNEVLSGPRSGGEESSRSPPEPPGARQGEEGEEGEEGDLPRSEKPATLHKGEAGKHTPQATVKPNLSIREAPQALAPRNWGTPDAPPFSRLR